MNQKERTRLALGLFVFTACICAVSAEAQVVKNQLTSAGMDDFVIKPGQAQPTDNLGQQGLQPRTNPQSLQSPNYAQPTGQPSLLPPAGESRIVEAGLTGPQSGPQTGKNARLGGGPEWQILQNPNGPHTAILFDPNLRVIAVYQIDSASGAITLKSVRNVSWDLQIEDYNSNKPAPQDIRAMQP